MASKKGASAQLKLASVLDLNEASQLKDKLLSMRGGAIEIDASGVERMGALCAQVLVSGAKTWEEDQKTFSIKQASDAFTKTIQLLGLNNDQLIAEIRQ
ncbi:STAS domain-containing protein [Agrobacterium vitis]|uniref:STAS domain-containing protein n=1 Tax=Agrobacterium vitis TaxID=373 RepID=UPI001571A025|nr:STAS domain-containing protein [Agrobacterium vitis]NSZ18060.1 STAS domain-containing protein [Agrobacterium vitis]QZO03797.1 STAS domain-containing protein [Agrobacterium vitis]UJL88923.1 STAS domain-containing protein [Agrobacterium vitis]BCH57997.1 chemotaxis protein CheX [Agrobacterium vitis]